MDASQIITLRKEKLKISQEHFASLLFVSSKTVYRWERGTNLPKRGIILEKLKKLDAVTDSENGRKDILIALSLGAGSDEIDVLVAKHYSELRKRKMEALLNT